MIVTENLGMVERRYSDQNVKLRQIETDVLYNDAVDVIPCRFTYEETDVPIDDFDISAEEALDILMGGDGNADDAQDGGEV